MVIWVVSSQITLGMKQKKNTQQDYSLGFSPKRGLDHLDQGVEIRLV